MKTIHGKKILFSAISLTFIISSLQIFGGGLGYTSMSNRIPWALWIVGDLVLIALGGGAFLTGFLYYIFRIDSLKPILPSAILVGLLCYLFTPLFIIFDIGQPLRFWFLYTYPNWGDGLIPLSMMTEVAFCVLLYLTVLCIEFLPISLKHNFFNRFPLIKNFGHYLHKIMWIFAATGTFFSFFHQGSLGGVFGVLYARPVWYRPHLFFLALAGAMAAGSAFTLLVTKTASHFQRDHIIPENSFHTLTKISGILFIAYFIFRIIDLFLMATFYVPAGGRTFASLWKGTGGYLPLVLELMLILGPVVFFNLKRFREKTVTLMAGAVTGVSGMVLNKTVMTLHGCAVPLFPWRKFEPYIPSVHELTIALTVFAAMVYLYIIAVKHLPILKK